MSEWRERAACRGVSHLVFFPENFGGRNIWDEARSWCADCPVIESCLRDCLAEEVQDPCRARRHGFRGGMSPNERVHYAARLARGEAA